MASVPVPTSALGGDGIYATVGVIVAEVQRRGIDPTPLLARHNLHPPRKWLPLQRGRRGDILAFVETCLEVSKDPGLHIDATMAAAIGAFEIADYLVSMAPTLGHGLRAVCERFDMVNSGIRFRFEESLAEVVGHMSAMHEPLPHPIETECTFVAMNHRMRTATNGVHGLTRVSFSHAERGSGRALRRAFACPVIFGAGVDTVAMSRAAFDSPTAFHHASLDPLIRAGAAGALPMIATGVAALVRRALAAGVALGSQRTDGLAKRLGLSRRSLQRKLSAEGVSLSNLLEETKRDEAISLLAQPQLSLSEIGERLGFSEPSAFTRAFRRWTGASPRDYRERHFANGQRNQG
ncbi:MAG: AraC family transcriptional regulator ligand-binding domain-containing protein [Deltaproteobacteria bacterium]|nr:AraC family transcriptional regulator ligand-binding domain-containing protein [Deltaproteobacteria bacterium]